MTAQVMIGDNWGCILPQSWCRNRKVRESLLSLVDAWCVMATQIDEAILAAVGDRWTKVAMVIARTARAVHGELPNDDQCYDEISQHIEALVADGRLAARGNIRDWRHSEVLRVGEH